MTRLHVMLSYHHVMKSGFQSALCDAAWFTELMEIFLPLSHCVFYYAEMTDGGVNSPSCRYSSLLVGALPAAICFPAWFSFLPRLGGDPAAERLDRDASFHPSLIQRTRHAVPPDLPPFNQGHHILMRTTALCSSA